MKTRISLALAILTTFFTIAPLAPASAVATTRYIAATGSVGAGTSCASPTYVGGSSIATAVSASSDGDTVIICDGTFSVSSQIFINDKAITISGQNSAALSIIDGSTSSDGIFKIISSKNVTIQKLTFFQGHTTSFGGAIYLSMRPSESLSTTRHLITNNNFVQNRADDQGGAIFGSGDNMGTGDFPGILTISNNSFIENYAAVDGGAIVMAAVAFDETHIIIDSNKFLYNRAGGRAGGALVSNFNTLTTYDNYFFLNTTGDTGNSETIYGRAKMGGDIIMNDLTSGQRDCRLENLSPTVTRTTRVDNPYCLLFNDSQVPGLTTVTRAQALALTGNFIPQSPSISGSTPQPTSVDLNLASRSNGGAAITQYSYSLNGGSFVNFPAGNATTQTITGLSTNTSYSVKVKATSSAGTSYASSAYSFSTTAQAADAPTITSVAGGDRSLTISFTVGADYGNAVSDIYYSLNGGGYISSGATTSPITLTSLTGRTSYSVRLKTYNAGGLSSQSNLISATTTDAAQDAADNTARIEAQRVADLERTKRIESARARVLKAVQNGEAPATIDLLESQFQSVTESTVPRMRNCIVHYAKGGATTIGDILLAASAVDILEKLADQDRAKRVHGADLGALQIKAFQGRYKVQILARLIKHPVSERDSLKELILLSAKIEADLLNRKASLLSTLARIAVRTR